MLVHDFLIHSAEKFPDKIAVIRGKQSQTYSDLYSNASRRAVWIAGLGLGKGFRGAILTDDPFDYIISYFAIQMTGGITVALNTQTCERSLKQVLSDCSASLIFSAEKYRRFLDYAIPAVSSLRWSIIAGYKGTDGRKDDTEWLTLNSASVEAGDTSALGYFDISPEDIAQIIYTSGTTGSPKGVMLRHRNLVANIESTIDYLALTADDRCMAVLPFFYSYGNSVFLTHFAVGGALVVNQNFVYPNVVLDEMVVHKVTGFSGVPSTFAILLNRSAISKYTFPALRYITQAGAAMTPQMVRRLQEVFPGVAIFIMYGQTEASPRLSYLPPEDIVRKPGSIGKAIPKVTLKLLGKDGKPVTQGEVGEIVASGENIMAGYWGRQKETREVLRQGWLWTGDLACMDDEGYLFMISRKSDMIKSGSHRIAPKEIEEILLEHAGIHEVAVIGQDDSILGEVIKACVVLKEGEQVSEKDLARHCRNNLAPFKEPHSFIFFDELPKNASGKIRGKG